MEKKISVIIPMYNASKHLNRSFVTVLNQTYKNLEIIVVNDGSIDDTKERVEEFQKKDSRIKLINEENAGVSHARNTGLKYISGDYVQFVDADDTLELNYFEYQVKLMEENDCDCAVCNNEHPFFYTTLTDRVYDMRKKSDFIEFYQHTYAPTLPWNKIYKREIIEGIEFDENLAFAEDEAHFCKCMLRIKKLVTNSKPMYHYYMVTKESNEEQDSTLNKSINEAAFWDNHTSIFYKTILCMPSKIETFEKGIINKLIPIDSIEDVLYQRVFDFTFYGYEAYVGFALPVDGLYKELMNNFTNTFFQKSLANQSQYGLKFKSMLDKDIPSLTKEFNEKLYSMYDQIHKIGNKNIIAYHAALMLFAKYYCLECNDLDNYNILNKCIKEYNEGKSETAKFVHSLIK